ncbi:hypothetical protein WKI13_11110 [Teredinibacter turnerae]|uniref:hypothetical protein n=1 Tax=Teredinibacter turnerae TaxID=2426 RepID=UPI000381A5BD|nr:hypothetical protein [Teredinibacter turnerae]
MEALSLSTLHETNARFRIIAGANDRLIDFVYAVDSLDAFNLPADEKDVREYRTKAITTEFVKALYVECEDKTALIIAAQDSDIMHNYDVFNQSIAVVVNNQIRDEGEKNGIRLLAECDHETFCSICVAHTWAIALLNSIELEDAFAIQAQNSFKHLLSNHKTIVGGKPFPASKHLEYFSWIYYVELRAIREIFEKTNEVKMHDVATNSAHFPLLINCLDEEQLFNLQFTEIICSDIHPEYGQQSIDNILSCFPEKGKQLDLVKLDLTQDNKLLEQADVIIANDILEHFYEDESFDVLCKLWERTKDLLLIHVPFEEVPTRAYGHLTSFNKEKLNQWARKLQGCENITEKYAYVARESYDPCFIDNFLFLKKSR